MKIRMNSDVFLIGSFAYLITGVQFCRRSAGWLMLPDNVPSSKRSYCSVLLLA